MASLSDQFSPSLIQSSKSIIMQHNIDAMKSFFEASRLNFAVTAKEIHKKVELNLHNFDVLQKRNLAMNGCVTLFLLPKA